MSRKRLRCYLVSYFSVLAVTLSFPEKIQGQRFTARIVGVVTDPSGATVPNAEIAGTHVGTGVVFKATSNAEGYYVLTALPVGEYTLNVQAPGFRTLERAGIHLALDQTARIDLTLALGTTSEKLTVTEEAPLISTENVAVNSSVDRKQITELPISFVGARSIMDFAMLGAGITSSGNEPYESGNYSINGSPQNTSSTSVDGASIAIPGSNMYYLIRPPVEEVREIQVQSGTFSPDASGFAALKFGTVSGSNQFHGTGFYYYENQDFTARSFFQKTVPNFSRKEGGWTVSGPILKNRTFFAWSYDGYWSSKPQSPIVTVPTDQIKAGNFQGVATIYDPNTTRANPNGAGYVRDPFPGNQIPQGRMDPVALKIMSYWPEPNIQGALVNNYNSQLIGQNFDQTLPNTSVKIDQKITDRNQLFVRYQYEGGGYTAEATYPGPGDYTGQLVQTHSNVVTLGDTASFSPRMVNEFRFGYFHIWNFEHTKAYNQDVASTLGLNNVSGLEFPVVSVTGLIGMNLGPRDQNSNNITENFQWNDNVTYIRGKHILKFGGNVILGQYNPYSLGRPSGQFAFSGIFTNQPQVAGTAVGFADFLLGLPSATTVSEGRKFGYRQPSLALFVGDDIKLARNLTMNLGVRFDRTWGVSEINNLMTNFSASAINPATNTSGAVVFAGRDGAPTTFSNPTNTISPRIGLAYTLKNKTVFRAGYSINYYGNPISQIQPGNTGFIPTQILTTTDQVTPLVQLQNGPPPLNTALNLTGAAANNQNVTWIQTHSKALALYQWSFGIQRELPGKMFVDATYVASRGSHLWFPINVNEVPTVLLGPGNAQLNRPFPQFQNITLRDNRGASKYHALQMTLNRRMASGLVFMANYTISKTMDNTSSDPGGGGAGAPYETMFDLTREWALSDHDTPQNFN
ncbi:MAG TPA: TonB-dependent receptor, partial [Bryobacteraceae bacterium]|nr:TonB-dependent receptor [Bryobacteraceae bacterium]